MTWIPIKENPFERSNALIVAADELSRILGQAVEESAWIRNNKARAHLPPTDEQLRKDQEEWEGERKWLKDILASDGSAPPPLEFADPALQKEWIARRDRFIARSPETDILVETLVEEFDRAAKEWDKDKGPLGLDFAPLHRWRAVGDQHDLKEVFNRMAELRDFAVIASKAAQRHKDEAREAIERESVAPRAPKVSSVAMVQEPPKVGRFLTPAEQVKELALKDRDNARNLQIAGDVRKWAQDVGLPLEKRKGKNNGTDVAHNDWMQIAKIWRAMQKVHPDDDHTLTALKTTGISSYWCEECGDTFRTDADPPVCPQRHLSKPKSLSRSKTQ